jgi:hypothetical protein
MGTPWKEMTVLFDTLLPDYLDEEIVASVSMSLGIGRRTTHLNLMFLDKVGIISLRSSWTFRALP